MDNLLIGSRSKSLTVTEWVNYTQVVVEDSSGDMVGIMLDDAELDELTNYLIELRGARRIAKLLE